MDVLRMFAVYDTKAEVYNTPFFFSTVGQALRAFKDLANDENTSVGKHPEDYRLVQLGSVDVRDGSVSGVANGPSNLGFASDYRAVPGEVVGIRGGSNAGRA